LIHIVLIKIDKSGTCYIHVGNNIKASDFTRNIVSPTNLTKAQILATPRYFPHMSHMTSEKICLKRWDTIQCQKNAWTYRLKEALCCFRSGVNMPLLSLSLTLVVCSGTRFSISINQPHSLLYLISSKLLVTHKFCHSSS
jgi:hypothetical protein